MERPPNLGSAALKEPIVMHYGEDAMKRAAGAGASLPGTGGPSPLNRTRSLSACERTSPKLSCSPEVVQGTKKTSKDDSSLDGVKQPETPRQPAVRRSNLSLQMFADGTVSPFTAANTQFRATPLSPKLDHSQIYASPTPPNMLPRRSRGLDFSRAATSLHHSTLAESSPDSSPIVGAGHAMDIPNRRGGHSGTEQTSSSLWSIMGTQEKANMSSSVGSTRHAVASNTSTSSEDEELMDEDTDEAFVGTPQFSRSGRPGAYFGSPSTGSIMSFQQRQRPRKQAKKKATKGLGPLALGFGGNTTPKSPPNNARQVRRESISWQANQLHISPTEGDDGATDSGSGDGQGVVVRRAVTRRGNMLPKTKTFARIKAVLVEESAPAEAECRREAEVVRQVRESDAAPEPRLSGQGSEPAGCLSALSSPNLKGNQESLNDIPEDDMIGEISAGLSSSFKQHAMKTAKRRAFWDTFSESSSMGGARTPPAAVLPRGSSSGISEDVAMDSPSLLGQSSSMVSSSMMYQSKESAVPSATDVSRRINSKRRRDDDFDPVSFKRRAVSPSLSLHNSPIMQSPLQRDAMPWGSRPGSNSGDKAGSSAPSDSGSLSGTSGNQGARINAKGRVGFQGMVDTNDGIMRMSIE